MKNSFLFLLLTQCLALAQGYHPQTAASYTAAGSTGTSGSMTLISSGIVGTGSAPGLSVGTSSTATISLDYEANTFATAMNQDVSVTGTPEFASVAATSFTGAADSMTVGFYAFSSLFTTDAANRAVADENGSDIATTYATVTGYYSGLSVGQSDADGIGNNIHTTYATIDSPFFTGAANFYGSCEFGYSAPYGKFDTSGNLWLNNTFVATPIVPTGSLIIYDSTGTPYLIPAVPQ